MIALKAPGRYCWKYPACLTLLTVALCSCPHPHTSRPSPHVLQRTMEITALRGGVVIGLLSHFELEDGQAPAVIRRHLISARCHCRMRQPMSDRVFLLPLSMLLRSRYRVPQAKDGHVIPHIISPRAPWARSHTREWTCISDRRRRQVEKKYLPVVRRCMSELHTPTQPSQLDRPLGILRAGRTTSEVRLSMSDLRPRTQ